MKKLLTLLMLTTCSSLYAQQEKKVEFRLGYGLVTVPQVIESISTIFAASLVPDNYTSVDLSGSGALFASVLFNPEKRFSPGLEIGYEGTKSVYNYTDGSSTAIKNLWLSTMVRGDFKYVNKPAFKLYSALSAGIVSLRSKSKNSGEAEHDLNLAFQLSPIGLRAGNNVAFWAEAGFGFKGVLAGGISFKM